MESLPCQTGPACGTATVLVPDLAFSNFATRSFHAFAFTGPPIKKSAYLSVCSTGANGALTSLTSSSRKTIRFEHITYLRKVDEPCPPPEAWLRRKSCIFWRLRAAPEISLGVGGIKRPAALVGPVA